jgi:hypothetical protein
LANAELLPTAHGGFPRQEISAITPVKSTLLAVALLATALASPSRGESYEPTAHIGEFLRQFATAYQAGDQEWIRSAVDPDGIVDEAKAPYFGFLGPKEGGEPITGLAVVAAPNNYQLPNSLLDFSIEPTIPVDFIITFTRTVAGAETTVRVPAGYRDGMIRLAGVRKK